VSATKADGVCLQVDVPIEACYLRIAPGHPARTEHVGTSARGEMVIFDYDAAGLILGID
jgi:hypothetical protein